LILRFPHYFVRFSQAAADESYFPVKPKPEKRAYLKISLSDNSSKQSGRTFTCPIFPEGSAMINAS
jgi:hypothetical protein